MEMEKKVMTEILSEDEGDDNKWTPKLSSKEAPWAPSKSMLIYNWARKENHWICNRF